MTEDDILLEQYRSKGGLQALQIGSGSANKNGWLNSDVKRHTPETFVLDATQHFPLPDDFFDYVYAEHIIEHIEYHEGCFMLRECRRVLKSGGVVRIVTPSISFLLGLFSTDRSAVQDSYLNWSVKNYVHPSLPPLPAFTFNLFVRAWGHRFIYDRDALRRAFSEAGFSDITECKLGESEHPFLHKLENAARMPEGFLALESMIFEGTKR